MLSKSVKYGLEVTLVFETAKECDVDGLTVLNDTSVTSVSEVCASPTFVLSVA